MSSKPKGLVERLKDGETVILAEGYLVECERRGYLSAGVFTPEVVLEHPSLVKSIHEEFVHCGSDVVLAFTYYGQRTKLDAIDRATDVETLNRKALRIARQVADETGTLMAGNISNTTSWRSDDEQSQKLVKDMLREQVEWAVEEGADFILGETFDFGGEAMAALECIKTYGKGLPAVINIQPAKYWKTTDGIPIVEMCKQLEEAGAACVGLNCSFGPKTIVEQIRKVRETCKIPISCVPVTFRTSKDYPAMQTLYIEGTGECAFPCNLTEWLCSRIDVADFTKTMKELNIQLIGLCCGNMGAYIRTMAETLGRKPNASKYSPDMSLHFTTLRSDAEIEMYNQRFK